MRQKLQQLISELEKTKLLAEHREPAEPNKPVSGPRPNILFVLVDELRFPTVFPDGIDDAAGFLQKYMPSVYRLWQSGVKFSNYYTAAIACTPSRGTLLTGLYSHQTWLCATITDQPGAETTRQPVLSSAFPTFGKLLRNAGYETPYIGKWHVSLLDGQAKKTGYGLDAYGFDGKLYPEVAGFNLQGTNGDPEHGYFNDEMVANTAVEWLKTESHGAKPWCLTVSFVNPHDRQFFWSGTEFQTYSNLFLSQSLNPSVIWSSPGNPPYVPWSDNILKDPPACGYPVLPPNWESADQLGATKPSTQRYFRDVQALIWGGVSDDPTETEFSLAAYPVADLGMATGVAPFSYWQRGLDAYTQTMSIVDQRIGEVLDALPEDVAQNTIIVFGSDHGEFAGAHGFLSGKMGTLYDEAFNPPLIVVDPSGRFTGDTKIVRDGLVSSVDLLRMFVNFGHNGNQSWIKGDLAEMYGDRHDILPMLKSAKAPGRDYVLLVTDEQLPEYLNYTQAPSHLIGLRTRNGKLGTYADWLPLGSTIDPKSIQTELYDYATEAGRLELDNIADTSPVTGPALALLLGKIVPQELHKPLPSFLHAAQEDARTQFLKFCALLRVVPNKLVQKMAGKEKESSVTMLLPPAF